MKSNEKSVTVSILVCDGQEKEQTQFYISLDGCEKLNVRPSQLIMEKFLKSLEQCTKPLNIKL